MATALSKACSYDALFDAWRFLNGKARPRSRNTLGVDGVCLNDYAKDAKGNTRRLARRVASGEFGFGALRAHLVLKANGKPRLICVPTVDDRIVQRAVLDFLSARYGDRFANPISYGFIRDRTVKMAAEQACRLRTERPWVYKTDISSFFDRVPRDELRTRINRVVRERSLHALLAAAIACEVELPTREMRIRVHAMGITSGLGLRQGMPLSPFMANLFLEPFDKAVTRSGLSAVRYADDLIFFAKSEAECSDLDSFCRRHLSALGLEIPPLGESSKTQIVAPDDAVDFLGLGLSRRDDRYELRLLEKQRDAIRQELFRYGSIAFLNSSQITLTTLDRIIQAKIAGYSHAYECCTNVNEFDEVLEQLHQTILRRIFGPGGLGLALQSLSNEARTFIGLRQ